jgi:hypothetical protein
MTKTAKIQPPGNGLDFDVVAQTGQRSMAAMAHLHSRAFRDAMKFNAELLDFTRRRIGANIETSDRLAHCESVTEAFEVVTGFCQGAVQDYAAESTALMRIGTEIAAKSTEETVADAARAGGAEAS